MGTGNMEGWKKLIRWLVVVSLGLLGAVASACQLLPFDTEQTRFVRYGLLMAITCLWVIGLLVLLLQTKKQAQGLILAAIIEPVFTFKKATQTDIKWIAELQARTYTKKDAVPLMVLKEWQESFPNGFFVVVDENQERIGHIDILPIRASTLKRYKEGTITETEIRGDSLYSINDIDKITDLYIESVILAPKNPEHRKVATRALLRNFLTIVDQVALANKVKHISAMAATEDGERILKRLKFRKISDAQDRRDKHNMFEADFPQLRETLIRAQQDGGAQVAVSEMETGL